MAEKSANRRFQRGPESRSTRECARFSAVIAPKILPGRRPRNVVVHQQLFEPATQMMHSETSAAQSPAEKGRKIGETAVPEAPRDPVTRRMGRPIISTSSSPISAYSIMD